MILAPGAVAAVPAKTRCGVRGWLAAAAEYHRGPAGLGLQLNYDTCDDGQAHAASFSSHRLSYADAYESLCGIALEPTRQ